MDRDGWLAEGFWNGALPPIGYRIVEAAKQRGHHTKKALEIDPIQAESVRMIFRLAREGNGSSGPMGVKSLKAQKRQVLECPVLYRSGAPRSTKMGNIASP